MKGFNIKMSTNKTITLMLVCFLTILLLFSFVIVSNSFNKVEEANADSDFFIYGVEEYYTASGTYNMALHTSDGSKGTWTKSDAVDGTYSPIPEATNVAFVNLGEGTDVEGWYKCNDSDPIHILTVVQESSGYYFVDGLSLTSYTQAKWLIGDADDLILYCIEQNYSANSSYTEIEVFSKYDVPEKQDTSYSDGYAGQTVWMNTTRGGWAFRAATNPHPENISDHNDRYNVFHAEVDIKAQITGNGVTFYATLGEDEYALSMWDNISVGVQEITAPMFGWYNPKFARIKAVLNEDTSLDYIYSITAPDNAKEELRKLAPALTISSDSHVDMLAMGDTSDETFYYENNKSIDEENHEYGEGYFNGTFNNEDGVVLEMFNREIQMSLSWVGRNPGDVISFTFNAGATSSIYQLKSPQEKAEDLIDAIGTVEYTQESKTKIDAARNAYNALDADKKQQVSNYDDLTAAEAAYKALDDAAKANEVKTKIDAIGTVEYTTESKGKIDDARHAYDNLTSDQKKLVDNYSKLTDAEVEYAQKEAQANPTPTPNPNPGGEDTPASQPQDKSTRKDTEKGVEVKTKDGTEIPENVALRVEVKTSVKAQETEADYAKVKSFLKDNEVISKVYDVKLIRTVGDVEEEIQPSDIKDGMPITVKMQLPKGVKNFRLLHIHSADDIEEITDFKVANGEAEFDITKLSEFAIVTVPSHGFCIGWVVFIFVILEMLATCLYIIIRFHLLDELVKKCKLDCLFDKLDLLTLIGLCVSGALFLCALIILCCHVCAISITSFILALLICLAFTYFYLKDKDIIDKLLKKQPKVEDKKEEVLDEPKEDSAAEKVEAELVAEKEETIEAIEAKEKANEPLTLKDSLALAKVTKSAHKFTKKDVTKYLAGKDGIQSNERENYTKTGLSLADTHYANGKCFAYVYETEGSIILLAKMNEGYANEIKDKHSQVNLSAFPKQKDTWYSLIIDDTYTKEEFEKILDDISK